MATVLQREALRWFTLVAGQFNFYYRSSAKPARIRDFVVAMSDEILMVEIKESGGCSSVWN